MQEAMAFFGALVQGKVYTGFHTISQKLGRILNQYEQIKQHYLGRQRIENKDFKCQVYL